jgi:hypothetical protein
MHYKKFPSLTQKSFRCFSETATQKLYKVNYLKALREETLAKNVKECQYAVRGAIPMRGEEIANYLKNNKGANNQYKFDKITPCNIGNP